MLSTYLYFAAALIGGLIAYYWWRRGLILSCKRDGGPDSKVVGFFFCEFKNWFSVVLLYFPKTGNGPMRPYHSHAFHALTWFITGAVTEHHPDNIWTAWNPSWMPKITLRNNFHRVFAEKPTLALSLRGPWAKFWFEYDDKPTPIMKKLLWGRHEAGSWTGTEAKEMLAYLTK